MIRFFKYAILALAIHLFNPAALFAQPGFGQAVKITADWRFHLGDLDGKIVADYSRSWQKVQLPDRHQAPDKLHLNRMIPYLLFP